MSRAFVTSNSSCLSLEFQPSTYFFNRDLGVRRRAGGAVTQGEACIHDGGVVPLRRGEVVVASMTFGVGDRYAIHVREVGDKYSYRAVDTVGGASLGTTHRSIRRQRLTLGQLAEFAMDAWAVKEKVASQYEAQGFPRDQCHALLRDMKSSFYPDFARAMQSALDHWLDTKHPPAEGSGEWRLPKLS